MFAAACTTARSFTRAVIISHRNATGVCGTGIGSFVVINDEGWIVTAWHIIQQLQDYRAACSQFRAHESAKQQIEQDQSINANERRARLKKLGKQKPDALTNHSVWWSWDGVQLKDVTGVPAVDLAVGRLDPFDPAWIGTYPVIKDPSNACDPGTSLCRLGFPFHSIVPNWDPAKNAFELPPGSVPPPFFPIEGIFTRTVNVDVSQLGAPPPFPLRFLETSSPGLRGQSGGPIFDQKGTVWAIQSQTHHLPLGFNPPVPNGKPNEREHQFLNVGWGIHAASVIGFLQSRNISFQVSPY